MPTPANGVVLLRYACYASCETVPAVESFVLKDAAEVSVPGSVVFNQVRGLELVIGFRPASSLTAGSTYTALLDGVPAVGNILVGPAVTWHDALTLTESIFEVDHPAGDAKCCAGPLDSCGNAACFRTEVDRRTTVTVGWHDGTSSEHYQYVFRRGRDRIDPAAPWSWDSGDTWFELDATEASSCYVLELKRLTDDSVQTFASRCVARPNTFTPGVHATPDRDVAEVLRGCDEPPDGYEEAWCEARAEICATSPDEPWCPELAARCATTGEGGAAGAPSTGGAPGNGGTPSVGGEPGMGGEPGNGGAPRTSGGTSSSRGGMSSGGGGAAGAASGEAGEAGHTGGSKRRFTEGCGCTVPGSGSGARASFALALAIVTLGLRRARLRRTE
jgi:hypothetical protein